MVDLTALTLADARTGLRARDIRAVDLAQAYLDAMARRRDWNAYITSPAPS